MEGEIDPLEDSEPKHEVRFYTARSLAEHLVVKHGIDVFGIDDDQKLIRIYHRKDHSASKRKNPTNSPIVKHHHRGKL